MQSHKAERKRMRKRLQKIESELTRLSRQRVSLNVDRWRPKHDQELADIRKREGVLLDEHKYFSQAVALPDPEFGELVTELEFREGAA